MNDIQKTEMEKSVLRWGGLAGIIGGIILILVFIIVAVFVGTDPAELEGWVTRFPDIRTARTVENSLYMLVLILWVPHYLALYRALRGISLAPALFGSVLGILGLVVLAAGAFPHVATVRLSNIYYAPETSPVDQATLVLLWQATWGIFDALLVTGLIFLPIGLMTLGVAMFKMPTFGKGFGGLSVVLGAAGSIAAVLTLIDPSSLFPAVGVFALLIFHLVMGWKIYSLSRAL